MKPSIGRVVHYVSFGTPGGEYTSECRAAIVTEVEGHAISPATGDEVDAWVVGLAVLNPTGMFFNQRVVQDELPPAGKIVAGERSRHRPGTWHWPERVD